MTLMSAHFAVGHLGENPRVGRLEELSGFADKSHSPRRVSDAVYDLASLTKVVCGSTLMAQIWLRSGKSWSEFLNLRVHHRLPEVFNTPYEDLTLGELWEHRSGLPAWKSVFYGTRRQDPDKRRRRTWTQAVTSILEESRDSNKPDLYSDLGFMILGLWIERSLDMSLSESWNTWKRMNGFKDWELDFGVLNRPQGHWAVPTEQRHPEGEVNDDNAFCLMGVSAHAGLFGTAPEVWRWLQTIVLRSKSDTRVLEWFQKNSQPQRRFHGGWDTASGNPDSQAGFPAPKEVLGHLGFTGTALWWNPKDLTAGVLLSNRVCPQHTDESREMIKRVRTEFFTRLWQGKL